MKLLFETSLDNLFIVLINDDLEAIDFFNKKIIKKADIFAKVVKDLLDKNKITFKEIDTIFLTKGPGSFMGSRVALTYARTIAQVSNIRIFTTSTIDFISMGIEGVYCIDASGGSAYIGVVKMNLTEIKFIKYFKGEFSLPDYELIIKEPSVILNLFHEETNLLDLKPLYIKKPQIGGK